MTLANGATSGDTAAVGFWCTVGCIAGCTAGCVAGCLVFDTPLSPVADVAVSAGSSAATEVGADALFEAEPATPVGM